MATAYEDILKNMGPLTTRTSDQEDLYNYALDKMSKLNTGSSDPYVQQILSTYSPVTQQQTMANVQGQASPVTTTPVQTENQVVNAVNAQGQAATNVTPAPVATPTAPVTPPPGTPEFQSQYDQQINEGVQTLKNYPEYQANPEYTQLIIDMLKELDPVFQYSAADDQALIEAQKEVDRQIREQMAARGALYSDTTASMVAQEMAKLVPQYRAQAQNEFQQTFSNRIGIIQTVQGLMNDEYKQYTDKYQRQADFLQIVSNLKAQEFTEFQSQLDEAYRSREEERANENLQLNKKAQEFQQALDRVNTLGYVDNAASVILGLPVGTETYAAKQAALKRQQEIEDRERAIQVQKEQDAADRKWQLEYLKAQEESSKRLSAYNASLSKSSGGGGSYSGGGGSSSGGGGVSYTTMNSALTQASKNGQLISFVEKLVFNPDMFIKQMTSENDYNKLVKNAQTKAAAYYKSIWANKDAEWILNTLQAGAKNNQDYYRWMMGDAAYQSMFDKAQASWKKVKQTGNPYYGK